MIENGPKNILLRNRLKIRSIIFTQAETIFGLWKYFQILKNVLKKIVHDSSYLYSYVVKMKKIMHNFPEYIFKVLKIYSKAKNSFELNEFFFDWRHFS